MNKKIKNSIGFSLMEAIIYLAIVGILLTAVVSLHLTLGGTSSKLTSNILVSRNRRLSMGDIDYLIKNSDGLLRDVWGDCSSFGEEPPVLALYFEDDTYLPGVCVENGGGVRLSVVDDKVSLTCYPNMSGNAYYQNCDTSVYPAGNIYYLTSPDTVVLDNSLHFSTSTSSSTANNFLSVTINLSVGTHNNDQVRLSATSTATSTAVLRNETAAGLVSWWKIDSPSYGSDTQANADFACVATGVAGLIDDSSGALDFNGSSSVCYTSVYNNYGFSDGFTISAWINEDTTGSQREILSLTDYSSNGFGLYTESGYPRLRIYDGSGSTDYTGTGTIMSAGTTYNITASYDLNNDKIVLYVYKKAVGGWATTTFSGIDTMVASNSTLLMSYTNKFDGTIDEMRVYNRPLSAEEVWAIQSQGAS